MRAASTASAGRERLRAAAERLAAAGVETPRVDAEWLLAATLGVGRAALQLALERDLDPAEDARFAAMVERRTRREPLQRILGWEEFRGLRFDLTQDVLVPRPETEILVEAALELLPRGGPAPVVVDVGAGSGCIAACVAHERPDARVVAIEPSATARAVAAANVRALGLAGRVGVVAGDLLAPVGAGVADLVVSNPPYLPSALVPTLAPEVREHEPALAIDGGPDGLTVLRRLVADAGRVLKPGGALAVETAGAPQARSVTGLMALAGFRRVAVLRDLTGTDRIVTGRSDEGGRPRA